VTLKNSTLEKCKAYLPRKWLCELENCTYSIKKIPWNSFSVAIFWEIQFIPLKLCGIIKRTTWKIYTLSLSRRINFWWISTEACYKNNFTSSNLDVNFNFVNKTIRISEQPSIKVTHPYIRNLPIEIDSGCDVLANRQPIRLINYTSKIKKIASENASSQTLFTES